MTNYAIATFTIVKGTVEDVASALETQLETLDSTNDPIVRIDIIQQPDKKYIGILLTS